MRSLQYEEATMIPRKDKNNYWYAYITVPIPLRKILKKKQLTKSLGTSDKRIAKSRLRETEAVLFQKLDEANSAEHPLVKSATALQEVVYDAELKWSGNDWFDSEVRFKAYRKLTDDSINFINNMMKEINPATPTLLFYDDDGNIRADENLWRSELDHDIKIETKPNYGADGKISSRTVTMVSSPLSAPPPAYVPPTKEEIALFAKEFDEQRYESRGKQLGEHKHRSSKMRFALQLYRDFEKEFTEDSAKQYAPTKRSRTLTSVIDEYLKSVAFKEIVRKNLKTAVEYESKIKVFSTWAGNITLDEITHKLGNDFVNELISEDSIIVEGGVANSTLIKYMTAVKNLWQWCLDQEIIPEKLWGNLKTKGKGKIPVKRRSLSHAELTKLFSIDHNKEDRLLLTCLATTGARFEEIAQLKWKHIKTWEDGSIYIDLKLGAVGTENDNDLMLKNKNSPREIPLLDQVVEQLPERPTDDEQKVFSYKTNRYKKHGQINKKLNRLIKREVIDDPSVVLHSLRHSFKTLFRATSNDYELGEFILGHQGAGNTSATYGESHALPQKKQAMVLMDFSFLKTQRLTDERKTTKEN